MNASENKLQTEHNKNFALHRHRCYANRMAKLDPIVSEFATDEDAEAHDKWFRAQVQAALDDKNEPCIPHAEVMARARQIIEKAVEKRNRANPDLAA
jgi:hypothetical protein